ncbi:MAG: AbrB/MazE/SpoVT family DNA-binding domain-containing protein [Armatimonadetes bacterium]|nr:AbrB/MazE/SpoVT family DNA-binding domain-containing protein [Armatimonadota bacterium]
MDCGEFNLEDHFLGTVTVGERGQVVIPAEARKRFGIHPGDRLMVVSHPGKGIVLLKLDALRDFMESLLKNLDRFQAEIETAGNNKEEEG